MLLFMATSGEGAHEAQTLPASNRGEGVDVEQGDGGGDGGAETRQGRITPAHGQTTTAAKEASTERRPGSMKKQTVAAIVTLKAIKNTSYKDLDEAI